VKVYGTDGQSKSHGKCTEPMECAEQKTWEGYGTHGVCRAKAMGRVRNPWSVQSKSHRKCAEPMECAEPKPWKFSTHWVYKPERCKYAEPEAQLNVQADRRPTSSRKPTAVVRRRLNMALGLLNWAIAELKGEFDNVATWSDAIKAMGVFGAHGVCRAKAKVEVYGTHGVCRAKAMGSVRNPWSVQSKSHGKCAEPMECAEQKPGRCAQPMECTEQKPWGRVRNPWNVQSKSHGKCAEPMECAEQKPGRCAQPMECTEQKPWRCAQSMERAEPKPWSAEPHGVCKTKAT